MSIWRLQVSWQLDSVNVRDQVVITPHFEVLNPSVDVQQLCEDLAQGIKTVCPGTEELRVKGYDAQGTVPVYPEGDFTINKGVARATSKPRELAVCLSFYGERNVPRQRGRLYLPCDPFQVNATGIRPSMPIAKIPALVDVFTGLGGVDVDWCVYSRTLDRAFSVTNWWYDDEFDVMRSRGMKSTARVQGTTSEAASAAVMMPTR